MGGMAKERAMKPTLSAQFSRIAGFVAGAIFIYAGVVKVTDPIRFATDISHYQIIPWPVGARLAFYLPWLEIICGLALIFRRLYDGALLITLALIVLFIGATIAARARGIDIACGCFGNASSHLTLTWHLILDGCILATLTFLWRTRATSRVVASPISPSA